MTDEGQAHGEPAEAGPADAGPADAGPADQLPPGAVRVRIRRAPRYRAFVLAGAVLGIIAGAVTSIVLGGSDAPFSASTLTGYVAAIGLLIGALLGAGVAVLVERPRSHSSSR